MPRLIAFSVTAVIILALHPVFKMEGAEMTTQELFEAAVSASARDGNL